MIRPLLRPTAPRGSFQQPAWGWSPTPHVFKAGGWGATVDKIIYTRPSYIPDPRVTAPIAVVRGLL